MRASPLRVWADLEGMSLLPDVLMPGFPLIRRGDALIARYTHAQRLARVVIGATPLCFTGTAPGA